MDRRSRDFFQVPKSMIEPNYGTSSNSKIPQSDQQAELDRIRQGLQRDNQSSSISRNNEQARLQAEAMQNRQRQQLGLPPLRTAPPSSPPPDATPPAPSADTQLKELSQPIPLPQLLPVSRQVKGKFEPQTGLQLYARRSDGLWYRAEVVEVLPGQKVKVRFAYDVEPFDGEVGRDRVRLANSTWPRFADLAAAASAAKTGEANASPIP